MTKRAKAWMPLYVSDFLIGTLGWEADAVGHYIRLLLIQWDKGELPAEVQQWEVFSHGITKYEDILMSKFPICADGKRRNFRLEEERTKAQEVYQNRVNAGKEGARKRWGGSPDSQAAASSSADTPPPSAHKSLTRGVREAREAYECAPVEKKQAFKRFLRLWEDVVLRGGLDDQKVIQSFKDYYGSPTGQSKYARGPHRLLEEAVWEDDPSSWGGESQEESMSMLDKLIGDDES